MLGRDDRVRRQAVHLGLVEKQEEGPEPADAVLRVVAVEASAVPAFRLELGEPCVCPLAQLVELAELDRLGGAGFRARRLVAALQAVVTERALPDAAVFFLAE